MRAITVGADGVVTERDLTQAEIDAMAQAPVEADVTIERDRRSDAGFLYLNKIIQTDAASRENIKAATQAAQDAKLMGAEPGDYGWQQLLDPDLGAPLFAWITADNSHLPLDADQMIEMGYKAMFFRQGLIFAADAIKQRLRDGETITDITDDALWP